MLRNTINSLIVRSIKLDQFLLSTVGTTQVPTVTTVTALRLPEAQTGIPRLKGGDLDDVSIDIPSLNIKIIVIAASEEESFITKAVMRTRCIYIYSLDKNEFIIMDMMRITDGVDELDNYTEVVDNIIATYDKVIKEKELTKMKTIVIDNYTKVLNNIVNAYNKVIKEKELTKMKTIVIAGFPGIGKSTLFNSEEYKVSDSDSSQFDKTEFPSNYIAHIKKLLEGGELDYILVSSHDVVRDALVESGIDFILVYPSLALKDEYISRYIKRDSPEAFVKLLSDNWDDWVTQCREFSGKNLELTHSEDNLANNLKVINKIMYKGAV